MLRVGGTRVTLDTVIGAWQNGATAEEIVQRYDALDLADVYTVIGYYLRNRATVEEYLARGRKDGARVRAKVEARFPQHGLRARLLVRRATTAAL